MSWPTVRGVSCILAHTPGLVRHGSKPARELRSQGSALEDRLRGALRGYGEAIAYPPNQVFIGNLAPEALWDHPQPWWANGVTGAPCSGPYGEILSEAELFGLLRLADEFDLVHLERDYLATASARVAANVGWGPHDLARLGQGISAAVVAEHARADGRLPLLAGTGELVGYVSGGYPDDSSQTPDILLENLACKATGAHAVTHLLRQTGLDPLEVDYLIGCGEEAVGDRYQRGGGSMAKAIAEMAGCGNATGADVKAFCSAPLHALVVAGALVQAGVYRNVVVVGGGSLAKLGMKLLGHLSSGVPILEDCLAGMAILVGPPDDEHPRLRLDVVGRHRVADGGSARQIYESLVVAPLAGIGLRIGDIDRYAVELHNPEITDNAGSGNVPRTNYRTIAALAVLRGELARDQIDAFERQHGMPGFCPTQGHIPAALPYLAHACDRLRAGTEQRDLFIAKGSLFLGKMTNLSDGMSIMVEAS